MASPQNSPRNTNKHQTDALSPEALANANLPGRPDALQASAYKDKIVTFVGDLQRIDRHSNDCSEMIEVLGAKCRHNLQGITEIAVIGGDANWKNACKLVREAAPHAVIVSEAEFLAVTDSLRKTLHNFAGKCVCFTSVLTDLSRAEAAALVKEQGGKVSSNVSSDVDFLIVGSKNDPDTESTKLLKARKLGITILDEQEFKTKLSAGKGDPAVLEEQAIDRIRQTLTPARSLDPIIDGFVDLETKLGEKLYTGYIKGIYAFHKAQNSTIPSKKGTADSYFTDVGKFAHSLAPESFEAGSFPGDFWKVNDVRENLRLIGKTGFLKELKEGLAVDRMKYIEVDDLEFVDLTPEEVHDEGRALKKMGVAKYRQKQEAAFEELADFLFPDGTGRAAQYYFSDREDSNTPDCAIVFESADKLVVLHRYWQL